MIESIKIRNFQAARDVDIPGSPVTSIVGDTDSGKSSIVRAIVWALSNSAPADCVSWGERECEVAITVEGHEIRRIRNGKNNEYVIDGERFAGLRGSVPKKAEEILQVGDDNMQMQFDPVFWFSGSGGELARSLNRIVNLDIIDRSFERLASRIRAAKSKVDAVSAALNAEEEDGRAAELVPGIRSALDSAKITRTRLDGKSAELDSLKRVTADALETERMLAMFADLESIFSETGDAVREYRAAKSERDDLRSLTAAAVTAETMSEVFNENDFISVAADVESASGMLREYAGLTAIVKEMEFTEQAISAAGNNAAAIERRIMAETGGMCPACGSPLNLEM